jgi:putative ABC transport system ATP-binding protein
MQKIQGGIAMILKVNDLSKIYKTGNIDFNALSRINFTLEEGDICTILGPSGSGKSTLINILGGIDSASSGSVYVEDKDITKLSDKKLTEYRRNMIGFIFQFYNLVPNLTVYENIEVASNLTKDAMDIEYILDAVDMKEFKNRFPKELSGGQQQRVSIARSLVKKPKLLFCDEPTGALDYKTAKEILKLITYLNKEFKTTVIIITHNNSISGISNRIIKLRSGEIIENKKNDNIMPAERIEW